LSTGSEKYKLISSGNLLPGVGHPNFEKNIQGKIKLTKENIKILVNGKSKTLKKLMPRDVAETYMQIFLQAGLDVKVCVDFTRDAFLSGLVANNKPTVQTNTPTNEAEVIVDFNTLFIESSKISPIVFEKSKEMVLNNEEDKPAFSLHVNGILGIPLLFFLTVYSALNIQTYFLKLLVTKLDLNIGASIIGVILFIFIIACFPLLIKNKRKLVFSNYSDSNTSYSLEGINLFDLLNSNYVLKKNGITIGYIKKKRYKKYNVEGIDSDGNVIFTALSPELLAESARYSTGEVASELVSYRLFEHLLIISNILKIVNIFVKKPQEKTTSEMSLYCLLLNNKKEIAAKVYKGVNVAVEIRDYGGDNNKLAMLYLLGLMSAGLN